MFTLPLISSGSQAALTPMERSVLATEQLITALMMAGTLSDESVTEPEREAYTLLAVATIYPAEA